MPNAVLFNETLTEGAKLLYPLISSYTAKEGVCWASNKHFAERVGVSERTISRRIQELAKASFLAIKTENKGTKEEKRLMTTLSTPLDNSDNIIDKPIQTS